MNVPHIIKMALPLIRWVEQDNCVSRQDAKKNLFFYAEAMGCQVNIIIPWRAWRLGESKIIL